MAGVKLLEGFHIAFGQLVVNKINKRRARDFFFFFNVWNLVLHYPLLKKYLSDWNISVVLICFKN